MVKAIGSPGTRIGFVLLLAAIPAVLALGGCEMDSFADPSVVGRWERTPVVLPILEQLDVIDEPKTQPRGMTQVGGQDLVADVSEYVIGPNDVVNIGVFELREQNRDDISVRRVNDLGNVTLPVIGTVKIAGLTPSAAERRIAQTLADQGVLRDATVTVLVQEGRQRVYHFIAERGLGTSGAYTIPTVDFRLLEAIAQAGGIVGKADRVYVIRPVQLDQPTVIGEGEGAAGEGRPGAPGATPAPDDPAGLIDGLMEGMDGGTRRGAAPGADPGAGRGGEDGTGAAAPAPLEAGLEATRTPGQWVNVDGKWVRLDRDTARSAATQRGGAGGAAGAAEPPGIVQRIIEVPYDKLLAGDMRYNVVVRPGDIVRVPAPEMGNVYIGGFISRPGTYTLPGEKELTLTQLVFAAGNLSPLAIPERVDITRRIGADQEATVRLNLRAIFEGKQPNLFLKANDQVNIGTSFIATPLAVVRNGFRASYGFGFILDRNFGPDVFGSENLVR